MLGPSGSGKTTTLRMIAGFELPTAGRVLLHGIDVTREPPFARDVNTVFQDYALFPHMSVGDNVAYGLVVRKVPKPERARRVGEALEMVRLSGYERRKPGQLSGGQRQRVALARALVNRPRVLLLDEPLGALDLKLREEMQIELKSIQQQVGITFIYVTHDQEEALTMSDRLAVFHRGRIEQVGPPADVYERPGDAFVAGFVGTSNLLSDDVARAIVGRSGTFTVRPEKIRMAEPRRRGRPATRRLGPRPDPERGLPGPGHAVCRWPRCRLRPRGHPAEPGHVVDRRAGARRQARPPDLEAPAQLRHRSHARGGGPDATARSGSPWPRASASSWQPAAAARPRAPAARRGRPACSEHCGRVRHAAVGRGELEPADRDRARARARSTSSSGPATPRTARTSRNTTGSTRSSRPTPTAPRSTSSPPTRRTRWSR